MHYIMRNIAPLTKKAIAAAKNKDWRLAKEINKEILEIDAHNISALNRLALARMQLGHNRIAEKLLKQILRLDKHNKIAAKNLERAKKKSTGPTIQFNQNPAYIEEPGKSQVIALTRTADKKTLSELSMGQNCVLEPKNKYISIYTTDTKAADKSTQSQYLGTLPQKISSRLIKLIKKNNEYECTIHSINPEKRECKVLVKESKVSEENKGVTSFPVNKKLEEDNLTNLSTNYPITNN